jgi:23S rRNA-/tRNA-specific pseudouridylate synthase
MCAGSIYEDSQRAETQPLPLEVCGGLTVAKISIVTGRTHQIRAQAAAQASRFPLYGGGKNQRPFFYIPAALFFLTAFRFRAQFPRPYRLSLSKNF